jgi:hypothetical protein
MGNATVHGSRKYPAVVVRKVGSSRDEDEDCFAVSGYLGTDVFYFVNCWVCGLAPVRRGDAANGRVYCIIKRHPEAERSSHVCCTT